MPSVLRRNLKTPAQRAYSLFFFYKIHTSGFVRELTHIRQLSKLLPAGNKLTGEKDQRIRFYILAVFHSAALKRNDSATDKRLNRTIAFFPRLRRDLFTELHFRFMPPPLPGSQLSTCSRLNNFALTVITWSFLLTPRGGKGFRLAFPSRAAQSSVSLNFTRAGTGAELCRSYVGGCGDSARMNQCTSSLYEVCISRPVHRAKLLLSNAETAIRGKRFCGVYGKAPNRERFGKGNGRARARERETRKKGFVTSIIRAAEIVEQRTPQGA